MNNTETIHHINAALKELSERHQISDWLLDEHGVSCLQLSTGLELWLRLADNHTLVASCIAASFDEDLDEYREIAKELNNEFSFGGTVEFDQQCLCIVCMITLSAEAIDINRFYSQIESLIATAEAIADECHPKSS